jgi:hypothetical protein
MSQVNEDQLAIQSPPLSAKETARLFLGSVLLIVAFWIAALLIILTGIAFAQGPLPSGTSEVAQSAIDPLPSLDSIDAHTDIRVFLRGGVPADVQRAALRRAWTVDPAIRDFRERQENDWDFTNADGVPGFGELGPEVDVEQMVARILGDPARLTVASATALLRRQR